MDTRQAIDIDTMEAGPEMDALVALEVMGFEPYGEHLWRTIRDEVYECWLTTDAVAIPIADIEAHSSLGEFYPSRDIGAAFEVAEKVGLALIPIERDGLEGYAWAALPVSVYAAEDDGAWIEEAIANNAIAPTAPLAICRTALRLTLA
jgi:hypothetical protein